MQPDRPLILDWLMPSGVALSRLTAGGKVPPGATHFRRPRNAPEPSAEPWVPVEALPPEWGLERSAE